MIDRARVAAFEAGLDPASPDPETCQVIAYGEVSAVVTLPDHDGIVLKRMSGFRDEGEVDRYAAVVHDYVAGLRERGLQVVDTEVFPLAPEPGRHVVYLAQPRLEAERLGHRVLQRDDEVEPLLDAVYDTLVDFYAQNDDARALAIDAQLSNWSWEGGRLTYLDVGTPFLRESGEERMDFTVLPRAIPQPLKWFATTFLVPGIVQRYYELDQAITDILANFVKEGRADLIDEAVAFTNDWLSERGVEDVGPFTSRAIHRYYATDEKIWELLYQARRLKRWSDTRLWGRRYDYLLPGKVKRR